MVEDSIVICKHCGTDGVDNAFSTLKWGSPHVIVGNALERISGEESIVMVYCFYSLYYNVMKSVGDSHKWHGQV
ncbi:hypothetical protein ACFLVS_01870 [Chloroflexota bacterium]